MQGSSQFRFQDQVVEGSNWVVSDMWMNPNWHVVSSRGHSVGWCLTPRTPPAALTPLLPNSRLLPPPPTDSATIQLSFSSASALHSSCVRTSHKRRYKPLMADPLADTPKQDAHAPETHTREISMSLSCGRWK